MEQLGFEIKLTPVEAVIEEHAEAWRANTKRMVAEAIEHINRSCGQLQRSVRDRCARESEEFWRSRRPWEEQVAEMVVTLQKKYFNRGESNGY